MGICDVIISVLTREKAVSMFYLTGEYAHAPFGYAAGAYFYVHMDF